MSVAKPTGEYADEMLEPNGWVEVDEQSLHDRAQELTTTLRQVTSAIEGFQHEETEIFGGGIWSGGGANSAKGKLSEVVSNLKGVQNDLVKAITWYQQVADAVAHTKTAIADRVEQAQSKISELEGNSDSNVDDQDEIDALVKQVHGSNVSDVTSAAGKIHTSAGWQAPEGALKGLLDQKAPPAPEPPGRGGHQVNGAVYQGDTGAPGGGDPGDHGRGGHQIQGAEYQGNPGAPGGGGPGGAGRGGREGSLFDSSDLGQSGLTDPGQLANSAHSGAGFQMPSMGGFGGGGGQGGGSGGPLSSMLSGLGGGQQNSLSPDMSDRHALEGIQRQDAGLQPSLGQTAMNTAAASAAATSASQVPLAAAAGAAQVNPAAARGPAATDATLATSAGLGAVSSGSQGGASSSASVLGSVPVASSDAAAAGPSMPLLPPATPHAAAPVSATGGGGAPGSAASGSGGPGVHPASTTSVGRPGFSGSAVSSQAEAAPAPIPVSSARVQKDAIADATRRQSGGGDVQVAYRLAAALNAPDMVNKTDFRFFWMVAVTADGQIVVANNYGLAFIPEGINLPAQIVMASADASVPVEERARWATYPSLALQGWAAHHGTTLRMVIAKREHFAGIDPGVPTRFVADEDIPASGKMQGRSRLEVIDPAEAARLASLSDLGLIEILPPAPVDASPPADQRSTLWFDLMKQMMSSDADRGVAQLQSFAPYAAHARELALYRAHSAVHAVEQRDAVTDWLYWTRIGELLEDALAGAAH